ncbi:MAG: HNH endonuclease [Caulobacteraceae bacterium]
MSEPPSFDPAFDMPITRDVAQVLAEHYGYLCQLNGSDIRSGGFHVDHVYPRALGGRDNLQNYVIACASANIGKNARRLPPDQEKQLLSKAQANAPRLLKKLTELRTESGGKPANPLVVYAFRLIGAEVGSRVATGAYLRAQDGPATGVMWWGYFGPDRGNGVFTDTLQFGVKVLGSGGRHAEVIAAIPGIIGRGGSTWYFPISASLPMTIDRPALEAARDAIHAALA